MSVASLDALSVAQGRELILDRPCQSWLVQAMDTFGTWPVASVVLASFSSTTLTTFFLSIVPIILCQTAPRHEELVLARR